MARRGFTVIFTVLGVVCVIFVVAVVALYLFFGRQPSVPSNATLSLHLGGDLAEVAPDDVIGYLRGPHARTVRSIVDNLRKAKVDRRVVGVLLKPAGLTTPFLAKLQEIPDASVDFRK